MNHPQYKHKLKPGIKMGEYFLMYSLPYDRKEKASNKRLNWMCKCSCGKVEKVPEYYMMRPHSPKKDCGHMRKTIFTDNPLYATWMMMHVRCEDPTHNAYKHYGGRGISVCQEWHRDNPDGFKNWLEYMGPKPSKKHTMDRIDNDGNYTPFQADGVTRQVRWATPTEQRLNQRSTDRVQADLAKARAAAHERRKRELQGASGKAPVHEV